MIINQSKKTSKSKEVKKTAIIQFEFTEYIIFVFQGDLSQFDILVKYKKGHLKIRTPKHIHWVVDILMKMQSDNKLTKSFLKQIQKCWNTSIALSSNNFNTLKLLIENGLKSFEIDKYASLDNYGEYPIEFLYVLMQLLVVQEKTNRADAYMFGKIIDELLEDDFDIFTIVSTAGYRGGK